MRFYTAQIAQWRAVDALGIPRVDVTAKSGIRAFAPDFERVVQYKQGKLSQTEYTDLYHERMAVSQRRWPERWKELVTGDVEQKCILCYCREGQFCHRHLLMDELKWYCQDQALPFEDCGEITKGGIIVTRWRGTPIE